MSDFTIPLNEVAEITDGDVGLDQYPIFDEAYRGPLNRKIVEHYWFRDIGVETIDMFLFMMRRKMNEVMPYYNQLYTSELLKVDPFLTFESTGTNAATGEQTTQSENDSTASNQSTSDGTSRTVSSETPQTRLGGAEDYATAAQDAASKSTAGSQAQDSTTGQQQAQSASEGETTSRGFASAQSELLMLYRQTFLNIDLMVIDELATMFMLVWGSNDEFTNAGITGAYGNRYGSGF